MPEPTGFEPACAPVPAVACSSGVVARVGLVSPFDRGQDLGSRQSGRSGARRRRLSRSGDFDRVYREGRPTTTDALVLYRFDGEVDASAGAGPRLGISVGRKLGGAAQRNRIKRQLREAFWARAGDLPPGCDVVLIARPSLHELLEERGLEGLSELMGDLITRSLSESPA